MTRRQMPSNLRAGRPAWLIPGQPILLTFPAGRPSLAGLGRSGTPSEEKSGIPSHTGQHTAARDWMSAELERSDLSCEPEPDSPSTDDPVEDARRRLELAARQMQDADDARKLWLIDPSGKRSPSPSRSASPTKRRGQSRSPSRRNDKMRVPKSGVRSGGSGESSISKGTNNSKGSTGKDVRHGADGRSSTEKKPGGKGSNADSKGAGKEVSRASKGMSSASNKSRITRPGSASPSTSSPHSRQETLPSAGAGGADRQAGAESQAHLAGLWAPR